MNLLLVRTYYPDATNGAIYYGTGRICFTIELPWRNNNPTCSCVPEDTYVLQKRFSDTHGWHLILEKVPGRRFILLHPANDALRELKGCIAPVTFLIAPGKGLHSQDATKKLYDLTFPVLERKEKVTLTIY